MSDHAGAAHGCCEGAHPPSCKHFWSHLLVTAPSEPDPEAFIEAALLIEKDVSTISSIRATMNHTNNIQIVVFFKCYNILDTVSNAMGSKSGQ